MCGRCHSKRWPTCYCSDQMCYRGGSRRNSRGYWRGSQHDNPELVRWKEVIARPFHMQKRGIFLKLTRNGWLQWLYIMTVALALTTLALAQQPPTIQYIYDDLNRLIKVIDPAGNVAEYVYDAVGNILEI